MKPCLSAGGVLSIQDSKGVRPLCRKLHNASFRAAGVRPHLAPHYNLILPQFSNKASLFFIFFEKKIRPDGLERKSGDGGN